MQIIPLFNIDEKDVATISCVVYVVVHKCLVPSVVEWHWADKPSCKELCKIGPICQQVDSFKLILHEPYHHFTVGSPNMNTA